MPSKKFMRTAQGLVSIDDIALAVILAMPPEDRFDVLDETHPEVIAKVRADTISQASQKVLAIFSDVREAVAKSHHYLQSARWAVQLSAAQDVIQNGEGAADLSKDQLDLEARLRARGETRLELAEKVLANSRTFTLIGAAVDGIETATLDAIAAYDGSDATAFDSIIAEAKALAQTEFLAIFEPLLGAGGAAAFAASIFQA